MITLPHLADATWSIQVRDADTGDVLVEHNADEALQTASVGKLFALIEAARALEAGEIAADEPLTRTADDMLPYISLWDLLTQATLPFVDVCQLTAAVSDNTATNVLLRRVGLDAVQATTRELGFEKSWLLDRVRAERTPDLPETLSRGTARELCDLMTRLHAGDIISAGVSAQVRGWIGANVDVSMVAAPFNLDPLEHNLFDRGIWLINKTGTIPDARADVGIVRAETTGGQRALVYAAIANWTPDSDVLDDVLVTMRALGAELRAELLR